MSFIKFNDRDILQTAMDKIDIALDAVADEFSDNYIEQVNHQTKYQLHLNKLNLLNDMMNASLNNCIYIDSDDYKMLRSYA